MEQNTVTGSEPVKNKHLPILSLTLATLTFLLTGLTSYLIYQNLNLKQQLNNLQQPPSQACTLEAKICPDGSSVGRTGPNCEFAPCPEISTTPTPISDPTADWKTYENKEILFSAKMPSSWKVTDSGMDEYKFETITFKGPEGSVELIHGSGFGGGPCQYDIIEMFTFQRDIKMCKYKENDDTKWQTTYIEDVKLKSKTDNNSILFITATAKDSLQANQDLITKTLSTFKFLD